MDIGYITAGAIRQTLARIRQARSLAGQPLLAMDAVTLRLRDDGVTDSPEAREWALIGLLHHTVTERLASLRGDANPTASAASAMTAVTSVTGRMTPAASALATAEQARFAADFRADHPDREAWSCLYYRFLCPDLALQVRELAALVLPGYRGRSGERLLERRIGRGLKDLEGALRQVEHAAAARVACHPGAHPRDRIRVLDAPAALLARAPAVLNSLTLAGSPQMTSAADGPAPALALLDVLRDDSAVVTLNGHQLDGIARQSMPDLDAYRLARVAEWSQPRHRLDDRFVALTLLVDQGEDAVSGRWAPRTKRYTDLSQVLADIAEPALVLVGPPGAGKSTLLRRLELDLAIDALRSGGADAATDVVTFLIPLSLYRPPTTGGPPPAPLPWLRSQWHARYPDLPDLAAFLDQGRLVLLLDGLNEMPHATDAEHREHVRGWKQLLLEVIHPRPGNRVIFACRSLDYSAPLSTPALRVPQVQIEPLADEQVRDFLRAYAPARAAAIWRELEGTPQLDLFRTPYLLHLLIDQLCSGGEVARGRAGLFTGFVLAALRREIEQGNALFEPGGLVSERDYRRVVQVKRWPNAHVVPDEGVLFPKLAGLAYGMQARGGSGDGAQVRMSYREALALLDDDRRAAKAQAGEDVLRAGEALGVLEDDPERDEVRFVHQLVQEYFAARKLALEPHPELVRAEWRAAEITPSLQEVQSTLAPADELPPLATTGWEETTVLAATMAADAQGFVRGLMDVNLALAARCANQPEVRELLSERFVDELRWALVERSRDPEADLRHRITCGLELGWLGDPRFERRVGPCGAYLVPPLVEIPGGEYPIGEDESISGAEDSGHDRAHMPRHAVRLLPFAIGRFAVTNAEFACFVAAGGYEDERWWETEAARAWRRGDGTAEGPKQSARQGMRRAREDPHFVKECRDSGTIDDEMYERWQQRLAMSTEEFEVHLSELYPGGRLVEPRYWHDAAYNNPLLPVVGICWYEARAYTAWLSAQMSLAFRLPTEVEWEAAARGCGGRQYAYGEVFDAGKGNTLETRVKRPTPVGVFAEGDTPEGASDMAGNVGGWTSSLWGDDYEMPACSYPYDPNDGREDLHAGPRVCRVLRGGTCLNLQFYARAAYRYPALPGERDDDLGLRLVRPSRSTQPFLPPS